MGENIHSDLTKNQQLTFESFSLLKGIFDDLKWIQAFQNNWCGLNWSQTIFWIYNENGKVHSLVAAVKLMTKTGSHFSYPEYMNGTASF